MNAHHELRDEIAAYVLGALREQEAAALALHLSECAACRGEYDRLRIATEGLALAVPQYQAPMAIEHRLMSTVRSEAQLMQAALAPLEQDRADRRWRFRGWFGRTPALAVGALALALVIGVLALAGTFSSSGVGPTHTFRAQISFPGASASLRVQDGRGELVITGMPPPPAHRIYEIWEQPAGGAPQPTNALFGVTRAGSASVAVPGSLRGVRSVLVTDEPLGGSRVPTRTPVIVVRAT